MSNRTLVEINHDFCPHGETEREAYLQGLVSYMGSGDKADLPRGVTFKALRHHSQPDPMAGHGDPS